MKTTNRISLSKLVRDRNILKNSLYHNNSNINCIKYEKNKPFDAISIKASCFENMIKSLF